MSTTTPNRYFKFIRRHSGRVSILFCAASVVTCGATLAVHTIWKAPNFNAVAPERYGRRSSTHAHPIKHFHDFGAVLCKPQLQLEKEFVVPLDCHDPSPTIIGAKTASPCCSNLAAEIREPAKPSGVRELHAVLTVHVGIPGRFRWGGTVQLAGAQPSVHTFEAEAAIYPRFKLEGNPFGALTLLPNESRTIETSLVVRNTDSAQPVPELSVDHPAVHLEHGPARSAGNDPFPSWRIPLRLEWTAGGKPGEFSADIECRAFPAGESWRERVQWKVQAPVTVRPKALLFSHDAVHEQTVTISSVDRRAVELTNTSVPAGYCAGDASQPSADRIVVPFRLTQAAATSSLQKAVLDTSLGSVEVVLYTKRDSEGATP